VRDYDFHPNEPDVRVFSIPSRGVLVRSDDAYVGQTLESDTANPAAPPVVLRHYAFADEWFKINVTFNATGELVETGPADNRFAINCDVATPLVWVDSDAAAVDLFLDVLVCQDGSYRVVDRAEFEDAASRGLISTAEAEHAEAGLTRLLHWITSGRLHDLIVEIPREVAAEAPPALAFRRAPLTDVPAVAPYQRRTW